MKDQKQLIQILKNLEYKVTKDNDLQQFLRRKVSKLYRESKEFKLFLDSHTKAIPKCVIGFQRWLYYINNETKPHLCPICNNFIVEYHDKYCSHICSTVESTGAKTGPKVDYAKKEQDFRKELKVERPDYKIVDYGNDRSTFKHKCRTEFEASNYMMVTKAANKNRAKCPCEHKKIVKHSIETLQDLYKSKKSKWKPIKIVDQIDNRIFVRAEHKECGHVCTVYRPVELCIKCNPNRTATRVKTEEEYKQWLKKNKPEFKLVGKYVDSKTRTTYKHIKCEQTFTTYPAFVTRKQFQCQACSPNTCGSYREFEIDGRIIKVRGKEKLALDYLLEHSKLDLSHIEFDEDGTVPRVSYREIGGGRTQTYRPDMYVQKYNLIIEVKDYNTIGLHHCFFYKTAEQLWLTNCAKAKACIAKGYKFQMMLFNIRNEFVKLPKEWYNYTHTEIVAYMKKKGRLNKDYDT